MICSACGQQQVAGAQFCVRCGARLPEPAAMPAGAGGTAAMGNALLYKTMQQRQRVRSNLQPLGITWILFGAYRLLTGLLAAVAFHTFWQSGMFGDGMPPFVHDMIGHFVPLLWVWLALSAAASIVTGYAILARKPWARTLSIVMGILALLKVPFGTALGIYTLWVMAPRAAGEEWERVCAEV